MLLSVPEFVFDEEQPILLSLTTTGNDDFIRVTTKKEKSEIQVLVKLHHQERATNVSESFTNLFNEGVGQTHSSLISLGDFQLFHIRTSINCTYYQFGDVHKAYDL